MTEKKTGDKKAPAKKAPAAKAEAPKKEAALKAAKPAATKAAAPKQPKAAYTGAKLTVMQFASPIGRTKDQRATLIGLGLNKMNSKRELQDTPEVRGMIYKIRHLVKVIG